jgi:hypothetical protein
LCGLRHLVRFLAGPASHNHVDQYLYYPEFRPAVLTISVPASGLAAARDAGWARGFATRRKPVIGQALPRIAAQSIPVMQANGRPHGETHYEYRATRLASART